MFNCGHTRDPFELLAPVLELYKPHVLSALEPTNNKSSATAAAAAAPTDSKQSAAASKSSGGDESIAFSHIIFTPFDSDRPHLQSIPTLSKLATTHKRTVPDATSGWTTKTPFALLPSNTAASKEAAASGSGLVVTPWQHTLFGVWDSLLFARSQKSAAAAAAAGSGGGSGSGGGASTAVVYPKHTGIVQPNVISALKHIRLMSTQNPHIRYRVLTTGSLYLVGNVLKHLNWKR